MASESHLDQTQAEPQTHNNQSLMNVEAAFDDNCDEKTVDDNSEGGALDDNSDEDSYDNENAFLNEFNTFGLQEINGSNFQMLNSELTEEEALSLSPDISGDDIDTARSKTLLSTGLEVKTSQNEDYADKCEEKTAKEKIRDEIENKVRAEMKDELKGFHERMQAFGRNDGKIFLGQFDSVSELDMDPKLREAQVKMKKLDNILLKKIQEEKKVKRNRILLEKRMRQEIAEMTKGVKIHQDVLMNTEKFLALEPPASHNEGVTLEDVDGENLEPFFQTQINETEGLREQGKESSCSVNGDTETNRTESVLEKSSKTKLETKDRKQKTDFIKRNKELAANADQPVAMTEDERKRLAELLDGVDELSDLEGPDDEDSGNHFSSDQVVVHPGEGFSPDSVEMISLANIDGRLKALMPEDDYLSFVHPREAFSSPVAQLFDRVGTQSQASGADLPERYRERALYETQDERELKARLESIEQELDKFSAPNEDVSGEDCHLTDEQLNNLLDQCARYMTTSVSAGSPELSARSIASSRASLLENPPKLTEEQLQMLLSEAHFPMSSRLLTVGEDGDKMFEDKNTTDMIRAETWKAIIDVDLEEQGVSVFESSYQSYIDHDLESQLEIADNVALNVSNNHNKNISTNNSDPNNHGQHSEQEPEAFVAVTSPPRYSAFDSIHTSTGSVANNLHGSSVSLPRISQSSGVSRSESYLDHFIAGATSIILPEERTEDSMRLPNISVKSFLIHAHQGVSNAMEKNKISLANRQPLEIVCDDLSDVEHDSTLDDKEEARGQSYGSKSSGRIISGIQPKPPKDRQCKDHQG